MGFFRLQKSPDENNRGGETQGDNMKKYLCGFYCEPLKWTVTAESEQEAARVFANYIKQNGITATSRVKQFVVFKTAHD